MYTTLIASASPYPRWCFDFSVAYLGFHNRVVAYLLLLRDEYPSTDEEQTVHLQVPYPDVDRDLNRWMPLVKWTSLASTKRRGSILVRRPCGSLPANRAGVLDVVS